MIDNKTYIKEDLYWIRVKAILLKICIQKVFKVFLKIIFT